MALLTRRSFLRGLFAAPAIIAIDRLMPVKALDLWPAMQLRGPATLFVDAKRAVEFCNGLTFPTLAKAMDAAMPGDTIGISQQSPLAA